MHKSISTVSSAAGLLRLTKYSHGIDSSKERFDENLARAWFRLLYVIDDLEGALDLCNGDTFHD